MPRLSTVRAVLREPWLLWTMTAVFAARDLLLSAAERNRPDTGTFWSAGRALLEDRSHLYTQSAAWLARYHVNPLPGGLGGFISPPTVAYLFAPVGLLSKGRGVLLWTGFDAVCLFGALLVLERVLRPAGSARPLFWLLAAFFPPVFAELDAGQLGGLLLLLSTGSVAWLAARPLAGGALAGAAAALKFYPAVLALAAPAGARLRYWTGLALAGAALLVLSFVPLGLGTLPSYFRNVLVPTLAPGNEDCALVSTPTLVARYAGGARWAEPAVQGVTWYRLPWGSAAAGRVLTPVAAAVLLGLALWAIRRAGAAPVFAAAVAFSLGALLPGTAFPYQMLALLPLLLVLGVGSARAADWRAAGLIALCLLLFLRAPCDIPVPNLWTFGAIGLLLVAVRLAPGFRPGGPAAVPS